MNYSVEDRAQALGRYIVKNYTTVRYTAKIFGISKSTVHTDITKRLQKINPSLYQEVRKILDYNKAERHIRGGIATKEKYQCQRSHLMENKTS